MNTTAIYVKTEVETKEKAQKVARELGLSLSAVVNGFLKQFIKAKTLTFSASHEEPSAYLKSAIKQAEEHLRTGKHSPVFRTGEDAVSWLEKQGM